MAKKKSKPSKKKTSKKKAPKSKSSKTSALSWQDQGQEFVQQLCKQSKSSKARLAVLSLSGDLIFQSGFKKGQDFTSIGALLAGLNGAKTQLESMLGTKTTLWTAGDKKSFYWVEHLKNWLVIGVHIPHGASLKKLYTHLNKRKPQKQTHSVAEALDGLADEALDAAWGVKV